MKSGRDEAPGMAHRHLGHARRQLHEPLLVRGLDGEDVDEDDELGFLRDCGHGLRISPAADVRDGRGAANLPCRVLSSLQSRRGFLITHELLAPTLDGLRHLAESASLVRKLVGHAHGGTVRHVSKDEAALFEVFQAGREHLVSWPVSALTKLAEAERTTQEDVQDERIPRAAQHVDGELKGLAPRIDRLGHQLPRITIQMIAA